MKKKRILFPNKNGGPEKGRSKNKDSFQHLLGFPDSNSPESDEYVVSRWNLNKLSNVEGSLLKYCNSSGISRLKLQMTGVRVF